MIGARAIKVSVGEWEHITRGVSRMIAEDGIPLEEVREERVRVEERVPANEF